MDPLRFPEQTWIDLAERALAEQNWRLAMRAFYLASLGWLGRREFLQIHSGKTNREYERELRRRARAMPEARELFARNIAAFERAWYGMHEIGGDDVERFRTHMREMQQRLEAVS
jgi:nucleotidyltransferase/DNA polymerase involved in DNA repair